MRTSASIGRRTSLVFLVAALSSGCVIQRQIKEVDAHPTYNNYKVQTISVHYAFFTAWQTWEVWTCHKEGGTFACEEVDYDTVKQGTHWSGPPAPPPAKSPGPAPAPPPAPAAGNRGNAGPGGQGA